MTESATSLSQPRPEFQICNNCQTEWETVNAFMRDPAIELVGYMPTFDDLNDGLILFNHHCGTTLACVVGQFEHLYDGPIYENNRHGHDDCPGYCLNKTELSPCPQECSCAFVRDVLQIVARWPKDQSS